MKWIKDWFKGHNIWYYTRFQGEEYQFAEAVFKATFKFKWYDMWMGVYIDTERRQIYVGYLPMCIMQIGYQAGRYRTVD